MEPYRTWVRNLRGTRSAREFAKMMGISQQALEAYEEGRRIPRDEVKRRLERLSLEQSSFFAQEEHNKCMQEGETHGPNHH